ncbi:L-2,4-diaminobutyric acid acetyltransferase [Devosia pacifica]|uniref:L-2,4-diaminobutyric acid acetyltransferase n=1 Tax=Devosia pacifica TaxID=1335967 RepID=A0A918SF82_9HYPH|nr:diaminobutyrate acetyltransferase [Devosia pacifica]GHA36134.1 L-2,4-diaminobutyric acid acetyltransferase [Devosia pacifica]
MHLAAVGNRSTAKSDDLVIRAPKREDGSGVWDLVRATSSLDDNSMYCNLLQCSHFSQTCALAELDGEVVGWLSGYIPPETPDVFFVWQVCVSEKARGRGLAKRLINAVLARRVCKGVERLQSTITGDNKASWALFGSIADQLETELTRKPHFERDEHFDGRHATEFLVNIGPFERKAVDMPSAA